MAPAADASMTALRSAAAAAPAAARPGRRTATVLVVLVLVLAAVFVVGAGTGPMQLSPSEVLRTLLGGGTPAHDTLLFHLRLPRLVLAVLVGAGLATSGVVLQGVVRNVLADPGLLGINAGAGFAAAVYVGSLSVREDAPALRNSLPQILGLPVVAFCGGVVAAALVYALSRKRGVTPWRLVLVGIAVGQGLSALTMVALTRLTLGDVGYAKIWLAGSIWNANWTFVLVALPWVAVCGAFAASRTRILDVLTLGDVAATGVGVPVERERRLLLVAATGLAAICVAVAGTVGFLGLFAPHIARRLVGASHAALLPTAALVGSVTLCGADVVGHSLFAPHEVPAGVVVAVVGAPCFLWLLARSRG